MLFLDISWLDGIFNDGDVDDDEIDFEKDFGKLDTNGDGVLDIRDCPYEHGTPKAKLWWKEIMDPYAKTQITDAMKTKYGAKCTGAYKGKPLVPGEAGRGQGDFQFLVDKLRVTRGLGVDAATKIAGKINTKLYGG